MRTLFSLPGEPVQPQPSKDSIGRGVGFALLCQLCCIFAGFAACALRVSAVLGGLIVGWGLAQLIVLIPLFIVQWRRGHLLTAKGIAIAGSIGFLLNAACDGLLWRLARLTDAFQPMYR